MAITLAVKCRRNVSRAAPTWIEEAGRPGPEIWPVSGTVWTRPYAGQMVETMDLEISDPVPWIKDRRERRGRLEVASGEVRLRLSERPALDSVEAVTIHARDITQFLCEGELAEARAFTGLLVKEVAVAPPHSSDAVGPFGGGQARRGFVPEGPGTIFGHRWRASGDLGHAGRSGILRMPRRPSRALRVPGIDSHRR